MIKTTPYSRRDEKWDLPVIQVKSKEEKMRLHLISSRTDSAESSRWLCLVPFHHDRIRLVFFGIGHYPERFQPSAAGFSLEAYKTVFKDPMVVFRAYGTTIGLTIVGTVLGLLLQTMTAYVLSRKEFEWRNQFSFFFYFTTLFSGGLVPYYVLMTQTLNLRDSYLALLLPLLFSVYKLLIMKSYTWDFRIL